MPAADPISSDENPTSASLRGRRVKRALLWVLGVATAIELGSCIAYRVAEGKGFSYSKVLAARAALVKTPIDLKGLGDKADGDEGSKDVIIHPFLGYVDGLQGEGSCDRPSMVPKRTATNIVVLVLGGSVAWDLVHDTGKYLERKLAPMVKGRKIELLNGALGGWKQPQQLMCLNYLLALGREPDVVINIDGVHEVAVDAVVNAATGVFPLYPDDWALRVKGFKERELVARISSVVYLQQRRKALAKRFSRPALRYSVTSNMLWARRDRILSERLVAAKNELDNYRPPRRRYLTTGPSRAPLKSPKKLFELLTGVWYRSSLQMHELAVANGIRYFHFLQPTQYLPGSKKLTDEERDKAVLSEGPTDYAVTNGYPTMRGLIQKLRAAGVVALDFSKLFSESEETLFDHPRGALNKRGHQLLAEAIAEAVRANWSGLSKATPKAPTEDEPTPSKPAEETK